MNTEGNAVPYKGTSMGGEDTHVSFAGFRLL
jgi:hypothetical protein